MLQTLKNATKGCKSCNKMLHFKKGCNIRQQKMQQNVAKMQPKSSVIQKLQQKVAENATLCCII